MVYGDAVQSLDIDSLLRLMVGKEASDLHLKAFSPPVFRVDGLLTPDTDRPRLTMEDMQRIFDRITNQRQQEIFEQEHELDLAYSVSGLGRFRVNVSLQRNTLALVFRYLRLEIPSLEELGLPETCKTLATRPRGIVLVTGPTGSGKSTTLAAMINYLNEREARRIVTIEDPIEYLHRDKKCFITQRELGSDTYSFATALKHALRQDPDVIMVGEMRDLDTISVALTAAETGHLVLATLHTQSAAQTIDRLIDVFPPHQQEQIRIQVSTTIEGVLCQTLIPRLDGLGRVAAVEVMMATGAIRNLIREGKTFQIPNVIQTGAERGMQTLDQALTDLYQRRLISLEDALARAVNPEEFKKLLGIQGL